MSRVIKRNRKLLGLGASWMLLMHIVDMYWFVMPYASKSVSPHWLDLACLCTTLGLYFSVVFRRMLSTPIIPLRDPRLDRSLHFHNA